MKKIYLMLEKSDIFARIFDDGMNDACKKAVLIIMVPRSFPYKAFVFSTKGVGGKNAADIWDCDIILFSSAKNELLVHFTINMKMTNEML